MSIDASTLPISPTFLIAAVGYAAISALITGPEIASREIARSDWQETCQTKLRAEIEVTRRPNLTIPDVPDIGGLLCGVYPELRELCAMIPDPTAAARATERHLQEAEAARINAAAAGSADQCTCAETVYIEDQRLSLALYAGSGRMITPNSVEHRETALMRALNNPACSFSERVAQ